ncbi:MAG: glycosyltransferase family 4 protein [Aphanothece sp. CMT-3BRIN-NPC111]|jgi:glycosyltransferase involved in cell wall biosynthesis|nr:glycosyltransferase family 4 protein [Aphanothece sp. CMT-3BRIN-NPC111]
MKILLVSNIFPPHVRGGYELGCLEIAQKYSQIGHSVIVASSENHETFKNYPHPEHIDVRRIFNPVNYYDEQYNHHFQTNSIYCYEKIMAFAGYIEPNCIALRRLIETESPDLVWLFNPLGIGPIGILDTIVSCQTKVIIHLMEHIDAVIQDYSKSVNLTAKWKHLKSQVTAVSCSQKILESNTIFGEYYYNKVIYNWIKLDRIYNDQDLYEDQILSDSTLSSGEKRLNYLKILYFGQLSEIKGVAILFKLANLIAKSAYKDRIKIELYGKGEDLFVDWLDREIKNDAQLAKVFVLKGFLNKESLQQKISEYDIAIFLLNDNEPFAYAPLEAMSKQVPVMLTEKAGNSEILKNEYNAILVKDRNDIFEIYKKLIWCLENPKLLADISQNAIKTLKQECDLDNVTVPALNEIIDSTPVNKGYSFEHVLSVCETLKYPYFELDINPHMVGARYKFIDIVVNHLYANPLFGKLLHKQVKKIIHHYRSNR